jgi:hypothetical protein
MKSRFALALVVVAFGCAQPTDLADPVDEAGGPSFGAVTATGPDAYRINGFGHQGSGNTIRTFAFSTAVAEDGSTTGSFELYARAAGVRFSGTVTCATVFGRAAWLGGTITTPGAYEGQDAVFRTIDLGAGTKGEYEDLLSLLRPLPPGGAEDYCNTTPADPPFFGAQGNITVVSPGETSFTDVEVIELEDYPVFVPCALNGAGEVVWLSGSFLNLFHVTEDPAGGTTLRYQFNPQDVSGYGEISGDLYQGTGVSTGHTMYTISGVPYVDSFVDNFRIIGQGAASDLLAQVRGQFTVNANGDVTVSDFEISERCRS